MAKKRNTFMDWWLRKWQLILYTAGATAIRHHREPRCCYWPRRLEIQPGVQEMGCFLGVGDASEVFFKRMTNAMPNYGQRA